MHWYGGSIAEAVNLSKQRNAIFVVFVEGENDLSSEMAATLNNGDIANKLSDQSNFLAIKLKSGSDDYTHFAQIYQFVPVPSLFFIGRNGTPLEVVCAGVEPPNLANRIDRILQEHYKDGPSPAQPSTSGHSIKEQTQNLIQSESTAPKQPSGSPTFHFEASASSTAQETPATWAGPAAKVPKTEHHEVTKSGQEYDVVCDGDVCVRKPKTTEDPGPSQRNVTPNEPSTEQLVQEAPPPESVSPEEKLERAKELIEAKKREKEEKDKELARQKELERRATGQGVAELKRWQTEQELKQIQEERKREKLENNMARQRILEQIAQDRAERRARDVPVAPAPAPAAAPAAPLTPATAGDAVTSARIQFKMPDGSSHTASFRADDTLGTVQQYVAHNLQLSASSFSLWTAFPRRELLETDSTLRRLELAPSAALLVLSRRARGGDTVARPSSLAQFLSFLTTIFTNLVLQPAQEAMAWLRARMFPPASPPAAPQPPRAAPAAPPAAPAPGAPAPAPPGLRYRPRTNIHRLTGDRSSDEDNNTWNGNSTQQM